MSHDNDPIAHEQRRRNVAACIRALQAAPSLTISAAARETGLSRPTVESILGELETDGLVIEVDSVELPSRGAGRPARRFAFRNDARYIAGVDVGPDVTRAILSDLSGNIWATATETAPETQSGRSHLDAIVRVVRATITRAGIGPRDLQAVSVGVPGVIASDGRVLVSAPIPEWDGVDVARHLSRTLGATVRVENDVNLAALGEHRLGSAGLAEDVVFLMSRHRAIGARVNAGIIIGRALHRGRHALAGEVAELGRPSRERDRGGLSDELADQVAVLSLALDPDVVVLGGDLGRSDGGIADTVRERVVALSPFPVIPTIIASELGEEVVVIGALAHAFEYAGAELYGSDDVPPPQLTRRDVPGEERADHAPAPRDIRDHHAGSPEHHPNEKANP